MPVIHNFYMRIESISSTKLIKLTPKKDKSICWILTIVKYTKVYTFWSE